MERKTEEKTEIKTLPLLFTPKLHFFYTPFLFEKLKETGAIIFNEDINGWVFKNRTDIQAHINEKVSAR